MNKSNYQHAIASAEQLLSADRARHRVEGNVQSDVEALLRKMNLGTLEVQYQTGEGPVDIYLPNRQTFIEVKPFPQARDPDAIQSGRDESAKEQLDRYVHAEIKQEDILRPVDHRNFWTGILTDGRNWHIYEYPHELNSKPRLVDSLMVINESQSLVSALYSVMGDEMLGKEWIPAKPHDLFTTRKQELDKLYSEIPSTAVESTNTKFRLWLDMMKASGMIPNDERAQERLFLTHSFLIVIVRLVSHSMSSGRDPWEWALRDGFASWVLGYSRAWHWAEQLFKQIEEYDWKKRRTDVFRDLYHEFVSETDRKLFGEFYTPDWLAEQMVVEVLDEEWMKRSIDQVYDERKDGVGVLDPACGSGTFLYHAAWRLASSEYLREHPYGKRADIICRLLNGIDIHPVAVEISKVNIERALPGNPTEGSSALQVYLGDSLQIHRRTDLFNQTGMMRLTSPKGSEAYVPIDLLRAPSFDEYLRRMVNAATKDQELPRNAPANVDLESLRTLHKQLQEIIKQEGNSVWTWYCTNLAGPHLLAERKVNRIIANPPWVKFSEIQVLERKKAIEDFGKHLGVHMGGKQAPHLDIAKFFVLHGRKLYLQDPNTDPGAWLVKVSALRAGHWERFRELHKDTLKQSVDLTALQPFGGGDATRCCILFEHCHVEENSASKLVAKKRVQKKRIEHSESLNHAKEKFELAEALEPVPQAPSDYARLPIRQGATIVPHVLARLGEPPSRPDRTGRVSVVTAKSSHKPWRDVKPQSGQLSADWIKEIYTSSEVLVYVTLKELPKAIVPISDGQLILEPGTVSSFWRRLDELWDVHRGLGKGTPKTLLSRFDYSRLLSLQLDIRTRERRMVIYPSSGDHMRAVRVAGGSGYVDSTLFWFLVRSAKEAGYLVSILNSSCLDQAFSESRESGRHFQLHPWKKVPIPSYNSRNHRHRRLAELCGKAEALARKTIHSALKEKPNLGQVGLSKRIRDNLGKSEIGLAINDLVSEILPAQARD